MTKERPTFSECVIGYRSWKLADWVLAPLSYGNPWRPGVNHARCVIDASNNLAFYTAMRYRRSDQPPAPENHTAPHENCSCGLHAYHSIPALDDALVVGAVAAWGDLQVHSNGFRAEHAQIVALVAADGLDEVAEVYGVPQVPLAMLTMEAHQHGQRLPMSMRPEAPKPKEPDYSPLGSYFPTNNPYWQSYRSINARPTWYTPPSLPSGLWTPGDEQESGVEDPLAKYRKPPANRQGPSKPKRAPKGSWTGR